MVERYFEKFPIVQYGNNYVRDITRRAVVLNTVYDNPTLYYLYDIQQGERADNVADRYYNDQYMDWIIRLTNKVIDPYYDWYLDEATFNDFIIKKYGSYNNATSKVKYYRNNWYENQDPISVSQFEALSESLRKFYDPVYVDILLSQTPTGYIRKQADWKKTTNKVVSYNVDGSTFLYDEIVDVYMGTTLLGSGQVCNRTTDALTIQHTSGVVTDDTGIDAFSVVGRESNSTEIYTAATLLADNIPVGESTYWSPVNCYDYELEINERNKSIQVLKKEYSGQISKELKNLLR